MVCVGRRAYLWLLVPWHVAGWLTATLAGTALSGWLWLGRLGLVFGVACWFGVGFVRWASLERYSLFTGLVGGTGGSISASRAFEETSLLVSPAVDASRLRFLDE